MFPVLYLSLSSFRPKRINKSNWKTVLTKHFFLFIYFFLSQSSHAIIIATPTLYPNAYACSPISDQFIWKWATSWHNQQTDLCAQRILRSARHQPTLTRAFAVRFMGSSGPKLPSCGQRRHWSDWADAQADLSIHWAHMSVCWFCHEVAHILMLHD